MTKRLKEIITEMSNTPADANVDIEVDPSIIDNLVSDDKAPMFITIEVLNEGVSKNGRNWDRDTILSVAEQINTNMPVGYNGHLSEADRSTKFPAPQTMWLGAIAKEVGGKLRLFAKGYVLPEAKVIRSYLKRAKSIGKNVAVSVYGTAEITKDKLTGVLNMQGFALESIDWARPGSEGVKNGGYLKITSEMIKEEEIMTREEILATATLDELNKFNASLVAEISSKALEPTEAIVSEMTSLVDALGTEDIKSTVSEMSAKLQNYEIDEVLANSVDNAPARKIIKQLVVSEMSNASSVQEAVDNVLNSESGQTIIKEMTEVAPKVSPMVDSPVINARRFTVK